MRPQTEMDDVRGRYWDLFDEDTKIIKAKIEFHEGMIAVLNSAGKNRLEVPNGFSGFRFHTSQLVFLRKNLLYREILKELILEEFEVEDIIRKNFDLSNVQN